MPRKEYFFFLTEDNRILKVDNDFSTKKADDIREQMRREYGVDCPVYKTYDHKFNFYGKDHAFDFLYRGTAKRDILLDEIKKTLEEKIYNHFAFEEDPMWGYSVVSKSNKKEVLFADTDEYPEIGKTAIEDWFRINERTTKKPFSQSFIDFVEEMKEKSSTPNYNISRILQYGSIKVGKYDEAAVLVDDEVAQEKYGTSLITAPSHLVDKNINAALNMCKNIYEGKAMNISVYDLKGKQLSEEVFLRNDTARTVPNLPDIENFAGMKIYDIGKFTSISACLKNPDLVNFKKSIEAEKMISDLSKIKDVQFLGYNEDDNIAYGSIILKNDYQIDFSFDYDYDRMMLPSQFGFVLDDEDFTLYFKELSYEFFDSLEEELPSLDDALSTAEEKSSKSVDKTEKSKTELER